MITFEQAQELLFAHLPKPQQTEVSLQDAVGKFLSQDILADRDYPPFNRVTMDGYAVNAADINEKKIQEFRVVGNVLAGDDISHNREASEQKLNEGEALRIMTGAALPAQMADAVIPLEDAQVSTDEKTVRFQVDSVKPQMNVAQKGEDIRHGQIVLPQGHLVRNVSILTLASLGCHRLKVFTPLRVAVLTTGNEVVRVDETPKHFQIRDSNSHLLSHFLSAFGITPTLKKCKDDKAEILAAVEEVLDYDVILLAGGISQGDADYVAEILEQLQVKKLFHKVSIKPGKPLWAGYKQAENKTTLILALPGNPMAVQTACKIFLEPLIRRVYSSVPQKKYYLPLAVDRKKRGKRREFFPCELQNKNNSEVSQILPLPYNGSGDVFAVSMSDGLGVMLQQEQKAGDIIEFIPWSVL